jgi:hypothetical protein
MQIILSILLYLNVISSQSTYTSAEIRNDVRLNKVKIEAIQADAVLLNTIVGSYADKVSSITVLDDGQLK